MVVGTAADGAERLLRLAAGDQAAQVLFAFHDLELPRRLAGAPARASTLAGSIGLHPLAADRFFNACLALGLIEREDSSLRLARGLEPLLLDRGVTAAILSRRESMGRWHALADRLRAWSPPVSPAHGAPEDPAAIAALASQHGLALRVGHALADAHDFGAHRRLLDLGAGTGPMSIAICRRHPALEAVAFDRPRIAELARARIDEAGLAGRIEVAAGDFLADPLPAGCDVVLLASVLSTADERSERELLRRVAASLPETGAAIISGWILDDARDAPLLPVLFCLEDILHGAGDVERSAATYASWLREAGFRDVRRVDLLPPWRALIARRAA